MDKGVRFVLLAALLLGAAILIQSTVLQAVAIGGVKPDLALIVLVFVAVQGGSMAGETAGFLAGLVQDFLSLSPLGLHALVRTLLGFLYGRLQGALASGAVLASFLLVLSATVAKGFLLWLASGVFAPAFRPPLTVAAAIELGYNSLLAPLVFALLGRIRTFREVERKEGLA